MMKGNIMICLARQNVLISGKAIYRELKKNNKSTFIKNVKFFIERYHLEKE